MMNKKIIDSTFISRKPLLPVIEIISPASGKKQRKNILADCIVVGRSEQSDIHVDDDKVSRSHFMLVRHDGKYEITDLNSSNGIIVNGKKTKKATLTGSDTIVAGNTIFNFILARRDLEKQVFYSLPVQEDSFDKKYTPKKPLFNKKNVFMSFAIGALVFISVILASGGGEEAQVTPIIKTIVDTDSSRTIHNEISMANLSEEDKIKAMNYFKLAEHHFKSKNYRLAKNSMDNYFNLISNSVIAPAFIAACEEALSRTASVDDKIDEIQKDSEKRELISKLLDNAFRELRDQNYENAINIFMKVILIDEYNESAYDGLITAEKALEQSYTQIPEVQTPKNSDMGKVFANQMAQEFNKKNYTKAYELSQRIIKMGEPQAGRNSFLSAIRTNQKIISITNKIYAPIINEAGLLEKSDAVDEAVKIYQKVLVQFPYNALARNGIKRINKVKNEQAKLLYSKALVEQSYPNTQEAIKNLKMILDIVPQNNEYYNKARTLLKKIG
jgi:tetratricopeptide (TPR) repeat protein